MVLVSFDGNTHVVPTNLTFSGTFETEEAVRHSSHKGRGNGGQLTQMRNLERLQTTVAPRSNRLSNLDARTTGDELNPMAPSQPPTAQAPSSRSQPKPRLKTKTAGSALGTLLPSTIQPSFSLAALGGHFGFRLPASDIGSWRDLDLSLTSFGP